MEIFKWISGCSVKEKFCDHDWEVVEYLSKSRIIEELKLSRPHWDITDQEEEYSKKAASDYDRALDSWHKSGSIGSPPRRWFSTYCLPFKIKDTLNNVEIDFGYENFTGVNKICMSCNTCHNGLALLIKSIEVKLNRAIAKKYREEQAKKLWKENCLFSDKINESEDSA